MVSFNFVEQFGKWQYYLHVGVLQAFLAVVLHFLEIPIYKPWWAVPSIFLLLIIGDFVAHFVAGLFGFED